MEGRGGKGEGRETLFINNYLLMNCLPGYFTIWGILQYGVSQEMWWMACYSPHILGMRESKMA